MSEKKKMKYETPKLLRVVLNHDQAILSGCSGVSTSISKGGTNPNCRIACRKHNATDTSIDSTANS